MVGPNMMESYSLHAPSQTHLLSNVYCHTYMFLVGCCVHRQLAATIKCQVYFIFLIFGVAQFNAQSMENTFPHTLSPPRASFSTSVLSLPSSFC